MMEYHSNFYPSNSHHHTQAHQAFNAASSSSPNTEAIHAWQHQQPSPNTTEPPRSQPPPHDHYINTTTAANHHASSAPVNPSPPPAIDPSPPTFSLPAANPQQQQQPSSAHTPPELRRPRQPPTPPQQQQSQQMNDSAMRDMMFSPSTMSSAQRALNQEQAHGRDEQRSQQPQSQSQPQVGQRGWQQQDYISHHQSPQYQQQQQQHGPQHGEPQFDIFEWYPKYQSCQRYFLNHAQHSTQVHAVAAFINILLPFQRGIPPQPSNPSSASPPPSSSSNNPTSTLNNPANTNANTTPFVSLIPYLRRLVITGLDFQGILHGFFGDDWAAGIGPLHEQERRNYLFAAKSGGWAAVKKEYSDGVGGGGGGAAAAAGATGGTGGGAGGETVPFMRPLQGSTSAEIEAAEKSWSEWLAMEDWMLGERCPEGLRGVGAGRVGGTSGQGGGGSGAAGGGGRAAGEGGGSGEAGGGSGGLGSALGLGDRGGRRE